MASGEKLRGAVQQIDAGRDVAARIRPSGGEAEQRAGALREG